jgi:hypothetical protein
MTKLRSFIHNRRAIVNQELKTKTHALEWYIGFANQDLKTIDAHERAKLLIEAEKYLFPRKEMEDFQRDSPPVATKIAGLAWALEMIDKESARYWNRIVRHQKSVRELFGHLLMTSHWREPPKEYFPGIVWRGKATFIWLLTKGDRVPYHLALIPITGGRYQFVRLKIMRLLEGLPQHAIVVCPGCKSYFLNWAQKRKRFCGEKCMVRVLAKERREANPEEYRKKQRDLMWNRYNPKTDRPRHRRKS